MVRQLYEAHNRISNSFIEKCQDSNPFYKLPNTIEGKMRSQYLPPTRRTEVLYKSRTVVVNTKGSELKNERLTRGVQCAVASNLRKQETNWQLVKNYS